LLFGKNLLLWQNHIFGKKYTSKQFDTPMNYIVKTLCDFGHTFQTAIFSKNSHFGHFPSGFWP